MNKKTIITVQHTESEHHLNGHAGAWGDWALTENGRKQAFEIGRWLLNEGCNDGFVMYCSDQRRASQTAEEINKTLNLTPIMSELIREVNAGEGNGKPWDWYDAHKIPAKEGYDPQFGARPVKRALQRLVLNELSKQIIGGKVDSSKPVIVELKDGELQFRN